MMKMCISALYITKYSLYKHATVISIFNLLTRCFLTLVGSEYWTRIGPASSDLILKMNTFSCENILMALSPEPEISADAAGRTS